MTGCSMYVLLSPFPAEPFCACFHPFLGGHAGHPAVRMCRTKSLTIETDPPILLYADGERICYTPATIEIIERGLTVIAPAE